MRIPDVIISLTRRPFGIPSVSYFVADGYLGYECSQELAASAQCDMINSKVTRIELMQSSKLRELGHGPENGLRWDWKLY